MPGWVAALLFIATAINYADRLTLSVISDRLTERVLHGGDGDSRRWSPFFMIAMP